MDRKSRTPGRDRFVALYRGINVGGKNPVRIESLRAMHERMGHAEVASYIQSGNIVFSCKGSPKAIAKALHERFVQEFGFGASVLVTTGARWATLVKGNPFAAVSSQDPKLVHVAICDGEPGRDALHALLTKAGGTERFEVESDVIYLHAPDGLARSKFAAGMERACGVPITLRNWRTVEAIEKMLGKGG